MMTHYAAIFFCRHFFAPLFTAAAAIFSDYAWALISISLHDEPPPSRPLRAAAVFSPLYCHIYFISWYWCRFSFIYLRVTPTLYFFFYWYCHYAFFFHFIFRYFLLISHYFLFSPHIIRMALIFFAAAAAISSMRLAMLYMTFIDITIITLTFIYAAHFTPPWAAIDAATLQSAAICHIFAA